MKTFNYILTKNITEDRGGGALLLLRNNSLL